MTASNVATFLFADIAGFTALTEAHGDEEAAALVADFCAAVNAELPAFGGTHVKSIGDALMLRVPEPADAVRLGLHIVHDLMPGHGAPAVRVGLHHGSYVERDGDFFGAAVNLAARVSGQAVGGEVLLTGHTAALAPDIDGVLYEPRGRQPLRNVREPVELFAAVRTGQDTKTAAGRRPGLPHGRRPRPRGGPPDVRRNRLLLLHAGLCRGLRAPAGDVRGGG